MFPFPCGNPFFIIHLQQIQIIPGKCDSTWELTTQLSLFKHGKTFIPPHPVLYRTPCQRTNGIRKGSRRKQEACTLCECRYPFSRGFCLHCRYDNQRRRRFQHQECRSGQHPQGFLRRLRTVFHSTFRPGNPDHRTERGRTADERGGRKGQCPPCTR